MPRTGEFAVQRIWARLVPRDNRDTGASGRVAFHGDGGKTRRLGGRQAAGLFASPSIRPTNSSPACRPFSISGLSACCWPASAGSPRPN